jgi:predicted RNA-binding protein YlqC (UPF0109 family)
MLDDKDVQKLIKAQKEVFVTKEEFESFIDIAVTKEDLQKFGTKTDANINKIVTMLGKMDDKLDTVVKLDKEVEYIKNALNLPALKK